MIASEADEDFQDYFWLPQRDRAWLRGSGSAAPQLSASMDVSFD